MVKQLTRRLTLSRKRAGHLDVRHFSMAHLHKSVATLRISGAELIPSEITTLLGGVPDIARTKGEQIIGRSGATRISKIGQWHLHATDTEPENLDAQVSELLSKLTEDIAIWQSVTSRFNADIFCGWFMAHGNEGVEISPTTLKALGNRGISLSLDIYGADYDA